MEQNLWTILMILGYGKDEWSTKDFVYHKLTYWNAMSHIIYRSYYLS